MFNQWTVQQMAAIQNAAALQMQLQLMNAFACPPNDNVALNVSDDDCDDDVDDVDDEQRRTLFVGNLEDRVTEDILYELFVQAGPIDTVRIPKDNSGKQRSFGFVVYKHQCSPPYAQELFQGVTLYRRTLKVQQQASGGGNNQQRRSLPMDSERYQQPQQRRNDNTALRNTNYPSYYDAGMNEHHQQHRDHDRYGRRTSPDRNKERVSKHTSSDSRPHQNSAPYQRRNVGGDRARDNEHQRQRQSHNGSNRRSGNYRRR